MITYIRYTLKGHYLELEEALDPIDYPDLGSTWEDYLSDVWVQLSDEQVEFKNKNPEASVQEVFEMKLKEPIVPEMTIEKARYIKQQEIVLYDSSEEVNIFYINSIPVWLDKATRSGLKLRFEAELAMGKTDTTLWYENKQFPLSLSDAINMLYVIEIYASNCYDNTQKHLAAIAGLDTIEEINNYNYTTGYPNKLEF